MVLWVFNHQVDTWLLFPLSFIFILTHDAGLPASFPLAQRTKLHVDLSGDQVSQPD